MYCLDAVVQVTILGQLRHPSIVFMYGVTLKHPHAYIVMEMCSSSLQAMLRSVAKPPRFSTRVKWCLQVAAGLEYLHGMGVIHR
jgi:serine/threonine protein kinase